MSAPILIAICFSLGFFVESIVGFGGALIAYSILGFFLDFKEMILSGFYVGTISSAYILCTDHKSLDKKTFKSAIPLSIVGTILGTFLFSTLSPKILSLIFGILLTALAIKIMFFDSFLFPKIFKQKLIFIGGIAQGAFGIAGPFWANALKNDFQNKSAFRSTLAALFVTFNLIRFLQLLLDGELNLNLFINIFWTVIPVFFAIKLGHIAHLKISENFFKKGIAVMTILAGLKFLSKAF